MGAVGERRDVPAAPGSELRSPPWRMTREGRRRSPRGARRAHGQPGRCRSGVATGRGAGGIRAGPCKKRAAAAAAGSAGRGARRARYRPDAAAERCSTARPAAAPALGPGPGPGPARRAGGAAALRGSPPSAHPGRSRSRYLQPGAAPGRNTCAATLHGAAKRHILLWMCFGFVVLGVFFLLSPLHLTSRRRKQSPVPSRHSPERRAARSSADRGSRSGANPAAARRAAPNFSAHTLTCPDSAHRGLCPQPLGAAAPGRAGRRRQLPLRRSGCLPSASLFISISQPLAVPALFTAAQPLAPPSRGRSLQPGRISASGA